MDIVKAFQCQAGSRTESLKGIAQFKIAKSIATHNKDANAEFYASGRKLNNDTYTP